MDSDTTKVTHETNQSAQPDVLWSYKLHEEMVFYQRINFFLVAESMLFVAYSTLLAGSNRQGGMLLGLIVLGFMLCLAWLLVSHRQIRVIEHISNVCRTRFADYAHLRAQRSPSLISSSKVLAYGVPAIVLLTWAVALKLEA